MLNIILLIAVIIVVVLLLVLIVRQKPPKSGLDEIVTPLLASIQDLASLKTQVDTIAQAQSSLHQAVTNLDGALKGVETRVVESAAKVKDSVREDLVKAREGIDHLKTVYEARRQLEEELRKATQRIEGVLVGSFSRGKSGENVLHEAFKQFPPDMIEYNFKVKGRTVEYALILPNKKRLPIDSKWPAAELLERLSQESDAEKKKKIERDIENELKKKVREVIQYIDEVTTTHQVIAAIPDAVFTACRRVHIEAFQQSVILMPYSMTIPYVLALYNLHLQFARSIDMDNLENYLRKVESSLNEIDKTLENSVARGATMIQNAYSECKKLVGEMRGVMASLKTLPEIEEQPVLKSDKLVKPKT